MEKMEILALRAGISPPPPSTLLRYTSRRFFFSTLFPSFILSYLLRTDQKQSSSKAFYGVSVETSSDSPRFQEQPD